MSTPQFENPVLLNRVTQPGIAILLSVVLLFLAGCQASRTSTEASGTNLPGPMLQQKQERRENQRDNRPSPKDTRLSPELTELLLTADTDSDKFVRNLYDFARTRVAGHFDVNLDAVTLQLSENAALERFVQRETKKLSRAVFDNRDFADFFLSEVMHDQSGTYAGLYVSPENRIVLNRELLNVFRQSLRDHAFVTNSAVSIVGAKNGIKRINEKELVAKGLLALLIHELVHAADNERFQIHNRRELNFRASVAHSAVFEGHAQMATREICGQLNCLEGFERLDSFMFEAPEPADPVARSLQAISRNVLEYAYVEGERFLSALNKGPDGMKRVEAALLNPPEDPVQILDPDNYPDRKRVSRNRQIFSRLKTIEHPWNTEQYALIETSPIKGLDLRADPDRRAATKEGFTRLIRSMVGAQLFDQQKRKVQPVEITVMQTDDRETATLFSQSFHDKSISPEADNIRANTFHLTVGDVNPKGERWPMRVFLTVTEITDDTTDSTLQDVGTGDVGNTSKHYVNLVANADNWIIQMGGVALPEDASMIRFSEQAMLAFLTAKQLNDSNF